MSSTAVVAVAASLLLEINFWPEMKNLLEREHQIFIFFFVKGSLPQNLLIPPLNTLPQMILLEEKAGRIW